MIANDLEKLFDEEKELAKLCILDGDLIILNGFYEIPLSRCNSHEKILAWICHLAEKTWVTTDLLRRFLIIASKANNIEIDHSV
jgi:hypothetical protein